MKVAIVGSGISGLVCAYKLSSKCDLTIYEKNNYLGGHTNTLDVTLDGKTIAVDTGFIVFNKKTYPHFLELIEALGVKYQPTAMSFSLRCDATNLEYNGTNLNRLFAQRRNFLRPSFYKFVRGILDFNRKAKAFLDQGSNDITLKDFVTQAKIAPSVVEKYLVPMASAVWSADPKLMWQFPANFILRFWHNHGFLEVNDRPQWYVISGGSREYVKKISSSLMPSIRIKEEVKTLKRVESGWQITTGLNDSPQTFDRVILACHSDQAKNLLVGTNDTKELLAKIPYQKNTAVLHTDTSVLPKRKLAHAAWNYYLPNKPNKLVTVHYHMNILQSLDHTRTFIVSLNPVQKISREKVIDTFTYEHPVFTPEAITAQRKLREASGNDGLYFAGAYLRYGFHEDGVLSALHACKKLTGDVNA